MSVTLATVADALIEFILSLLRDPELARQFDASPHEVLTARGLGGVHVDDVRAVAPIVADRPDIVVAVHPHIVTQESPSHASASPVVREVHTIVNNLSVIDDRDTIIDQSVNQNIWAGGDVTQTFDNEAVAATGDDSIAAGDDVDLEQTQDESTTITAGGDANVGNDTSTTEVDDSFNQATDASTTTDDSTTTTTTDSFNDAAATAVVDDSMNSTVTQDDTTTVDVDSNSAYDSSETTIIDDSSPDDDF